MIGRSLTENDLYLSFVFLLVFVFSIVFFPFPSSCWSTHLVWLGPSLAEDGLKSLDPVDQRISPRESFIYLLLDKPGRKKKTERTGILEALVTWKTEEGHFLQFRHLHSVGSFSIVTHLKKKKLFGCKTPQQGESFIFPAQNQNLHFIVQILQLLLLLFCGYTHKSLWP